MRVQTLTIPKAGGFNTCDRCHLFERCVKFDLFANGKPNGEHVYCINCLMTGEVNLCNEVEVVLPYGKKERKRTNKKAKRSEAKTAKETGGSQTGYFPGSGDSRNSKFFFEDKTRVGGDRKSFRLTQDIVTKGRDQAGRAGLIPVFRIHLKDVSIGAMLWDDLVELVRDEESDD